MLDNIPAVIKETIETFERVNTVQTLAVIPFYDGATFVLFDDGRVIAVRTVKLDDYYVPEITTSSLDSFIMAIRERFSGEDKENGGA